MVDIGFVILHYKTFQDTKNCVESIIRNVPGAPIVVVDNGSANGTGEKLRDTFINNKGVTIIFSEKNLGFANGNNLGIKYIRQNYLLKFVAVMNNDTLVLNSNFLKVVDSEYLESHFAVLGPQIITLDGAINSNPVEQITDTPQRVAILLIKKRIKLLLNKMHFNSLLHDVGTSSSCVGKYNNLSRYENVKLHGSCWIFSENFFSIYEGINSSTFLYFEEDILYSETVKKGMKTVYNPNLKIKHLEDSSTNRIVKSSKQKNVFVLEHEIQSLKVLMRFLKSQDIYR